MTSFILIFHECIHDKGLLRLSLTCSLVTAEFSYRMNLDHGFSVMNLICTLSRIQLNGFMHISIKGREIFSEFIVEKYFASLF